jgi:hypothetical protein
MRRTAPLIFESTAMPTIHTFQNLIGETRGRLAVLRFAGIRKRRSYWICLCDCGLETVAGADALNSGRTKSCGCLQSEITVSRNHRGVTHGHNGYNSPEYRSWTAMKSRCYNPKSTKFEIYGGIGVRVCDRWSNSFEAFLSDMGPRPLGTSLDRFPDKEGNYAPDNCRWATIIEQNNNRRPFKRNRKSEQTNEPRSNA